MARPRTITRDVEVTVTVSMDDFEDDDLIEELRLRGYKVVGDVEPSLEQIYYAMRLGNEARAIDMMREYLRDQLGRV